MAHLGREGGSGAIEPAFIASPPLQSRRRSSFNLDAAEQKIMSAAPAHHSV